MLGPNSCLDHVQLRTLSGVCSQRGQKPGEPGDVCIATPGRIERFGRRCPDVSGIVWENQKFATWQGCDGEGIWADVRKCRELSGKSKICHLQGGIAASRSSHLVMVFLGHSIRNERLP